MVRDDSRESQAAANADTNEESDTALAFADVAAAGAELPELFEDGGEPRDRRELQIEQETLQAEAAQAAERVYGELITRAGEADPRPRIAPVRRLAELAGSPHTQFPVIHVAGTNGKTSTSRAIEALLRAHGLGTGLFTSPHLVHFTERFQLGGVPVDGSTLESAWQALQPALKQTDAELAAEGQSPITFFEALAVLAFELFAHELEHAVEMGVEPHLLERLGHGLRIERREAAPL